MFAKRSSSLQSNPTNDPLHIQSQPDAFTAQGVDAIYCLSVNDKHVMRAWAIHTPDCMNKVQIKMVADGNADFVKAIGEFGVYGIVYGCVI